MTWLQSIDAAAFAWVNQSLRNPWFDWLMPFLSGNPYFFPTIVLAVGWRWCTGGRRGRVCLLALAIVMALADPVICSTLKQVIGRPRPFLVLSNVHLLVGRTASFSLPSGHATNWFAATMTLLIYYRRSVWIMLPLAVAVAFSRVYNGVHYPSDVLMGAAVGAGSAAAIVWALQALWQAAGQRWFPLWWARLPSLLTPEYTATTGLGAAVSSALLTGAPTTAPAGSPAIPATASSRLAQPGAATVPSLPSAALEQHWLRLGYVMIGLLLLLRLLYLHSGQIELSEDEAYQWTWSKHLALSYYSKPPFVAYTQFLGTTLWGDSAFGVRFFSPVMAALLSLLWLRFLARHANARPGLILVLIATTTPLLAVGSILLTIDPLLTLFWSAALMTGWSAIQQDSTRHWLLTGLWVGCGFLSKYTAMLQPVCWAIFFCLWKPARAQLRRPGPYLALAVAAVCTLPVLCWNAQHGWITLKHVATNAGLDHVWHPTLRFFFDFVGGETALLNPVFLVGGLWASLAFWRHQRWHPLCLYLFCLGGPLFLGFWLYSLRYRIFPNWIAPSVLPLLALMVLHWDSRVAAAPRVKAWLRAGLLLGAVAVGLLHDTDLIPKLTGYSLPAKKDPLRRVRAWSQTAEVVGRARQQLLQEGQPVFLIGDHYGIVGELSFYLPAAQAGVPDHPLVYYETSEVPENQYFFWSGYTQRHGENAIYIQQTDRPKPPPERVRRQFASMEDLGLFDVRYHSRVFRTLQLFACRHLK